MYLLAAHVFSYPRHFWLPGRARRRAIREGKKRASAEDSPPSSPPLPPLLAVSDSEDSDDDGLADILCQLRDGTLRSNKVSTKVSRHIQCLTSLDRSASQARRLHVHHQATADPVRHLLHSRRLVITTKSSSHRTTSPLSSAFPAARRCALNPATQSEKMRSSTTCLGWMWTMQTRRTPQLNKYVIMCLLVQFLICVWLSRL